AEAKRSLIEVGHHKLSVRRQCALLGLSRSSLYYEPAAETSENLRLMRRIDEQYTACPFYGSRRMTAWLVHQGEVVNRKRVQRLMRTWRRPTPSHASVHAHGNIGSTPTCCVGWPLSNPTRCGVRTSPTFRCPRDSCTWQRFSTGTAVTWWPGGCRIR